MAASGKTMKHGRGPCTASGYRMLGVAWLAFTLIGSSPAVHAGESHPVGKLHAGTSERDMDVTGLKPITWPDGRLPQLKQAASSGTPTPATSPIGNLNQVMRAILFPNANLIFNVQLEDPGAEKPAAAQKDTGGSFSITAWGDSIYSRWEAVSYAAVALEESALLLMKSERRCQNGKPVPVAQADWTRFTAELAETARAVYTASQSKNRDVVIDLTDRLSEACASCHNVYRRGPDIDRCVPRP